MGMLLGGKLGAGATSSTPLLETSELDMLNGVFFVFAETIYVEKNAP